MHKYIGLPVLHETNRNWFPYKIVLDRGRKYNGPKVGKSIAA